MNEFVLSSVAITDGQIFLRGDKHLYAIGSDAPDRAGVADCGWRVSDCLR